MGGAFARTDGVEDAVSGRDAAFFLELIGWLAPHVAAATPRALAELYGVSETAIASHFSAHLTSEN